LFSTNSQSNSPPSLRAAPGAPSSRPWRGQDVIPIPPRTRGSRCGAHRRGNRDANPLQVGDHRLVVIAVLQVHAQTCGLFFRRLEVRDIALFFQDAGNLVSAWKLVCRLSGAGRGSNCGCASACLRRIGQPHRLLLLEPPVRSAFGGEPVSSLTSVVRR